MHSAGSALKCWDCASNFNALCGDPMNITEHHATFHTKVCESSFYETSKPICRKIVKRGKRIENFRLICIRKIQNRWNCRKIRSSFEQTIRLNKHFPVNQSPRSRLQISLINTHESVNRFLDFTLQQRKWK